MTSQPLLAATGFLVAEREVNLNLYVMLHHIAHVRHDNQRPRRLDLVARHEKERTAYMHKPRIRA